MSLRPLALAVIALATLIIGVLFAGFLRSTGAEELPSVSLERLMEQGVVHLEDEHVIFVHHEGEILALSDDAQHVGDIVHFCPSSQLFESRAHGEKFDIRGRYFAGPASRGLARYEVKVEQGNVIADMSLRIEGPPRGERAIEPQGPYCLAF